MGSYFFPECYQNFQHGRCHLRPRSKTYTLIATCTYNYIAFCFSCEYMYIFYYHYYYINRSKWRVDKRIHVNLVRQQSNKTILSAKGLKSCQFLIIYELIIKHLKKLQLTCLHSICLRV